MLSLPIEGHHVASKRIIEAAASAGIDTNVVTIESGTRCAGAPKNYIIVNSKINPRVDIWFFQSLFSAMDDLLMSANSASWVKSSDCNLIHVLNVNKEAYLIAHNLLRVKKPLLFHFYHSSKVLSDDIFLIRNFALRIGLYGRILNNHVLTINLSLYKFLIKKLGVNHERVHYAPYPVDINKFKPLEDKEALREKYALSQDRPIVVYVGSLDPVRGIFDLIKALKYASIQFPNLMLYISHPNREGEGPYKKYLKEIIRNLKLQSNVLLIGPSAHVEEIFNLADAVVLPFIRPYWMDPPLVLLEAMSCGAAVVATTVGALSEVIRKHENGILTKPNDPMILAKAIIELINNPEEAYKIGRRARETIVEKYSFKNVVNRILKIYKFVLQ